MEVRDASMHAWTLALSFCVNAFAGVAKIMEKRRYTDTLVFSHFAFQLFIFLLGQEGYVQKLGKGLFDHSPNFMIAYPALAHLRVAELLETNQKCLSVTCPVVIITGR